MTNWSELRSPDELLDENIEATVDLLEEELTVACDGCRGDGIYFGRGAVVNGKFEGFTGTCFRCQGKGHMTPADVRRCSYYDNRVRRFSVG